MLPPKPCAVSPLQPPLSPQGFNFLMTFPDHRSNPAGRGGDQPFVRVQSLGSGSSGNAFLIEHDRASFLLDCGVGIRTLRRAMMDRQQAPGDLDAILITHEHIDHIRTLPQVPGLNVPVIASRGTFSRTRIPEQRWLPIAPSVPIEIAGATIRALAVRHDAAEPCGFMIQLPTITISILTDLGSWEEHLLEPLLASNLIVLEANHDVEMLRRGPYPAHLKRRVASAVGHLSNDDCGTALAAVATHGSRTAQVWLAHLSGTNNRPDVATTTINAALHRVDHQIPVIPLPRGTVGPVWTPGSGPAVREQHGHAPGGLDSTTQLSFDGF